MKGSLHSQTPILVEGIYYGRVREPPVYVRLGVPSPDTQSTHGDVFCPIEVRESETGDVIFEEKAFGINALQAVENAFRCIRRRRPNESPEEATQ